MKNSKIEIRNSKDLAREAHAIRTPELFHHDPRDPRRIRFEFRISNFEFSPC